VALVWSARGPEFISAFRPIKTSRLKIFVANAVANFQKPIARSLSAADVLIVLAAGTVRATVAYEFLNSVPGLTWSFS
jgi:hypothetical protein